MKLLMLRGLSASGKSTYAKELVSKDDSYVRVNKDLIREMVHGGFWSQDREKTVLLMENAMIEAALKDKKNAVVDNTHLAPKHENRLRQTAALFGAEFEIKDFHATVEECIKRDLKRPKPVGEAVIRKQWRDYVIPRIVWPEDRRKKQKVVIVDLDGTIAEIKGRSPYDSGKCEQDGLHRDVWDCVDGYGPKVLFCSGRKEEYRAQTEAWIAANCDGTKQGYPRYAGLLMRKTDDNRPDWVVKFEILRDEIAPNWDPIAVFDDRNQVVDMWRAQGLRCYQVADGEF